MFTTAAQKAAPKHAIWMCRTLDADGNKIGPFLDRDERSARADRAARAARMSVDQAQVLARRLGLKLTVDC